ncbi:hypothetical protein ACIBH1_45510 [Nonomuraea sp. NPDC050663]|uniref:hypothetical protein n=1 Tax=Nonomuraea sp. NPDC050663 TaxID=3364370 RepID=UPI0037AFEBF4
MTPTSTVNPCLADDGEDHRDKVADYLALRVAECRDCEHGPHLRGALIALLDDDDYTADSMINAAVMAATDLPAYSVMSDLFDNPLVFTGTGADHLGHQIAAYAERFLSLPGEVVIDETMTSGTLRPHGGVTHPLAVAAVVTQ